MLQKSQSFGRIMKKISLVLLFLSATGCSMLGGSKPDKREWVSVSCIGFADWQVCHDKAKKLCANGYDTRNMQESLITQNRSMEVACKTK